MSLDGWGHYNGMKQCGGESTVQFVMMGGRGGGLCRVPMRHSTDQSLSECRSKKWGLVILTGSWPVDRVYPQGGHDRCGSDGTCCAANRSWQTGSKRIWHALEGLSLKDCTGLKDAFERTIK